MSSPELSDDEDSFEVPQKSETIVISEDDSNETILYDEDCLTSDEDIQLPEVKLRGKINKKNVKSKHIFSNLKPNDKEKSSTSIYQRDKIIKNLFSRSKPSTSFVPEPSQKKPVHTKMIGGVKVDFPMLPYGSQIALVAKVIESINKKVNSLLESPTGTGKTLALLCGALAWQRHETNRLSNCLAQEMAGQHPELKEVKGAVETIATTPSKEDIARTFSFTKAVFGEKSIYDNPAGASSKDASPTSAAKRMDHHNSSSDSSEQGLVSIHKKRRIGDSPDRSSLLTPPAQLTPEKQVSPSTQETPPQVRVPTIYYGARTHKQIQQVVREFGKTVYCGEAKMTILSSREHSCIRPFDRSLYPTKNDMCKECVKKVKGSMLNDSGVQQSTNCKYYENRKELTWDALPPAFDLEDLVSAGHEISACPFFAARAMVAGAQIVFCPYNYLIDPSIRSSIEIKDEIVILDEAHNIEDICRDAATFNFNRDQILGALNELEYMAGYSYANQDIKPEILFLMQAMKNWNDWFGNQRPLVANQPINNNEATFCWQVEHFVQTLNNHNIGVKTFQEFQKSAESFCRKLRDDPATMLGVTQSTGTLLESMAMIFGYLFRDDGKQMDDFKPALIRTLQYSSENLPDPHGWRTTQHEKRVQKETVSLRVMCMFPGVVFSEVTSARCVLLASGTLAPPLSLHSELATRFPLAVSPPHVIPPHRVWIGTLSTCSRGRELQCKSQATRHVDTQDGIGDAVLHVASVTPHGVLCFVPSYLLMNKLHQRWIETGLWKKLSDIKHLFMESRNLKDHNDVMDEYYRRVTGGKGALLLAVYRGKVSEGMDFKDEQARAVITIGIPYPNTYDMMVKEKMLYNDRHTGDKNLLPSGEWLRVQAYRALNQAIGRCVRHREDWGAVLLVDARFTRSYYTQPLSGWVRTFLGNNHHTFQSLVHSAGGLEPFMQAMTLQETEDECL